MTTSRPLNDYMYRLGNRHPDPNVHKLRQEGSLSIWQIGSETFAAQDYGEDGFSVYAPMPNTFAKMEDEILKHARN